MSIRRILFNNWSNSAYLVVAIVELAADILITGDGVLIISIALFDLTLSFLLSISKNCKKVVWTYRQGVDCNIAGKTLVLVQLLFITKTICLWSTGWATIDTSKVEFAKNKLLYNLEYYLSCLTKLFCVILRPGLVLWNNSCFYAFLALACLCRVSFLLFLGGVSHLMNLSVSSVNEFSQICSFGFVCDRKLSARDGGKPRYVEHRHSKPVSHSSMREESLTNIVTKLRRNRQVRTCGRHSLSPRLEQSNLNQRQLEVFSAGKQIGLCIVRRTQ